MLPSLKLTFWFVYSDNRKVNIKFHATHDIPCTFHNKINFSMPNEQNDTVNLTVNIKQPALSLLKYISCKISTDLWNRMDDVYDYITWYLLHPQSVLYNMVGGERSLQSSKFISPSKFILWNKDMVRNIFRTKCFLIATAKYPKNLIHS